jgi:hypothetical protein
MQAMRSDSRCLVRDGLCGREQDCIRDLDYFKANAIWHQAAHDMIGDNGPRGWVLRQTLELLPACSVIKTNVLRSLGLAVVEQNVLCASACMAIWRGQATAMRAIWCRPRWVPAYLYVYPDVVADLANVLCDHCAWCRLIYSPAFPHNMDGVEGHAQYAWCDYDLNPSC